MDLASLAKEIRLREIALSCESIAVHLPSEANVTADALSRLTINASFRDKVPNISLRRKLFRDIQDRYGPIHVDGFANDDGSNALCEQYHSPSSCFFENWRPEFTTRCFPPRDMVHMLLKFLDEKMRARVLFKVLILLPEQTTAPWFRHLQKYQRVARFRAGSDLFRQLDDSGAWQKCPATKSAYTVLMHQ